MYGLYIDDVKGTCSSITDTMCVKYKEKNLLLFWACKSRAVTVQITRMHNFIFFQNYKIDLILPSLTNFTSFRVLIRFDTLDTC